MSDGYNKPQYHAVRSKSAHEPAIGDEFEWRGHTLKCLVGDKCSGCFFNRDHRKTLEHRTEAAEGCISHFCESEVRVDACNVKFKEEVCQAER